MSYYHWYVCLIRWLNYIIDTKLPTQVPKEKVDDFKCVKTFKIFNTNNLWINLAGIRDKVKQGILDRDVIVNHKTLDDG